MKRSLMFFLASFLFAGSELIFSQNNNISQNTDGFVYLTAPDGTQKFCQIRVMLTVTELAMNWK